MSATQQAQGSRAPAPEPELTIRAIVTGFALGALLAPCNIYSGLKIGWSFNMSIVAVLLSYAFWNVLAHFGAGARWEQRENAISQTAASSAGSILSAGLVAPIPAWTMITGESLPYPLLVTWVFVVSFTGIIVAVGLRQQMLIRDQLPFPNGFATAETLREIYSRGREGVKRIQVLFAAMLVAGGLKLVTALLVKIPSLLLPLRLPVSGVPGVTHASAQNLGFYLEPSLLMVGFGGIVGMRVAVSLLLGAILAWGLVAVQVIEQGWVDVAALQPSAFWFGGLIEWLLWPGVALMVSASLTSFALAVGTTLWRFLRSGRSGATGRDEAVLGVKTYGLFLGLALLLTLLAQILIFHIEWHFAVLAFVLTFLLAVVAGRVSGETGIPPIGALGKMTQLVFGLLIPGSVTHNLMSANVTGGAAGQCSDLLHDFKTGQLVGVNPRFQMIAQLFGILSGALVGSAAYLVLVPDPAAMLLTQEWPAPAVATWKAVAELFRDGSHSFEQGSAAAAWLAVVVGTGLAVAERLVREERRHLVPSAASIGLAFVIPAATSIAMFIGALLRLVVERGYPAVGRKYALIVAAGLVAGESLAGVALAVLDFLGG